MKSTNAKKTLCQVCKDAGKTEKEYTSHFVRDKPGPDGVTVCPLLLSLNCRKCGKKGHTFKYCKVNMEKKKEPTPRLAEKPNDTPKQKQGKFDLLVESSDEEEEGEEKEPEPIKQNAVEVEASPKVMSYADKLKAKLLPLAPTLPDMAVLRSAPTLPDMVVLPQAPTLPQAPALQAPTLPQAPALQAPTLPRAPILPVTEEEKEKIQKLKDGCKKIISQKCSWAESDSESDEDED
jgi:hypothetical protein